MKTHFLHHASQNKDLILFFAGFASHPSHFAHLSSQCSVLMVYDYTQFSFDENVLKDFENITLIAFSMGVCVASKLLKNTNINTKIKQKIAINGTNFGIDKQKGIHPVLFMQTMKSFNLSDFKKALFGRHLIKAKDFVFKEEESLKKELESLFEFVKKQDERDFVWDKIYASCEDKIFPPKALCACFSNINLLEEEHFVFFSFSSWEELCLI
ncbi:pimeloyl-ACP methyl esterase BioG family protein [Helicobacter marmotae]|uniref:DUF452 domain-containing protein n=1 Tax=Helicobacter marmotae TaxID=152490 RepID=A0A3D8I4E3_9HELI|nr:pimeloyl-ACP methyl esterase BioG family protein [Helicobacter marmotae]RDU59624.1 DUF452 domain-containing protein [Helicobacter marmotae]